MVKVQDTNPQHYLAARRGDILSTGELSHATRSTLFAREISRSKCEHDLPRCIQRLLNEEQSVAVSDEMLAAVAELATAEAIRLDTVPVAGDSSQAVARFFAAARYSYAYLFRPGRVTAGRSLEVRQTQVRDYYNYATERAVQMLFGRVHATDKTYIPRTGVVREVANWVLTNGEVQVRAPWHATGLEAVVPASSLQFDGLRNVYRRDGIGAELVAVWSLPRDESVSVEIAYHPTTVLLSFDGASDQELLQTSRARLDIYDPYQQRAVRIQGEEVALAGNFTGAYGLWLARSKFNAEALRTLFGRREALDHAEVLMMQPYDPTRLTVVLIHGLGASPDSWVNVANEILGDERLRNRYQIWQVFYPSNLPVAISQREVRQALEQTFARVDPGQVNDASHHIVLVGHSMGGIISRLLVSTGSERIWEERYQAPAGSERRQSLARLEPYLDFRPLPGVDCAVFLATPHAGTPYAHHWLGRRIASLIHLPATLVANVDRDADAIEGELPEVAQMLRRHPNAINLLDSSDPFFEIIGKLDIAPGVTYHQIIARKDSRVPVEDSDDGYVPYRSAYLPGAASTLVVESGHRVQLKAPAILELRRILLLHAAANHVLEPLAVASIKGGGQEELK